MDETYLYQQIAETIRQEILSGQRKPGDRLPTVRQFCEQWGCTPGTIQRAYNELARAGLVVSHAGRGTQVAGEVSQIKVQGQTTLRRANLVHRSEAFLLEAITSGYDLTEIQQALDLAMDRWRSLEQQHELLPEEILRFAGSHDMIVNELARVFFGMRVKETALNLHFSGSLGGLIALAEGKADIAGSHLWDQESDRYNLPFIQRLLPGKSVITVRLADRRQGLMVTAGNPLKIHGLEDLVRPGVRFINRQAGSGTRVWLDATLRQKNIQSELICGYLEERLTHSDVARDVAEGHVDVGLGLESAALAYGLDFVFLNRESYDLVMLASTAEHPAVRSLIDWLASAEGRQFVQQHPGYESSTTGLVQNVL